LLFRPNSHRRPALPSPSLLSLTPRPHASGPSPTSRHRRRLLPTGRPRRRLPGFPRRFPSLHRAAHQCAVHRRHHLFPSPSRNRPSTGSTTINGASTELAFPTALGAPSPPPYKRRRPSPPPNPHRAPLYLRSSRPPRSAARRSAPRRRSAQPAPLLPLQVARSNPLSFLFVLASSLC
jgi:hypothetical protein